MSLRRSTLNVFSMIGLVMLIVLLATGWTGLLRDLAYSGAFQNYTLAVFLYVLLLLLIGKVLGLGLDYYSFRLEHEFNLSNQRIRSWLWDEVKAFLVAVVMAAIVAELLYLIMRLFPEQWWLVAWGAFMGLFILLAQIAPVVLSRLHAALCAWPAGRHAPHHSCRYPARSLLR